MCAVYFVLINVCSVHCVCADLFLFSILYTAQQMEQTEREVCAGGGCARVQARR